MRKPVRPTLEFREGNLLGLRRYGNARASPEQAQALFEDMVKALSARPADRVVCVRPDKHGTFGIGELSLAYVQCPSGSDWRHGCGAIGVEKIFHGV
ncbi:hypothetical protein [Paracoccus benzoatiresistens]|uniref:Uncharacterized protein n=1 Tax=Paracoccus benzoatiresistens TaxID=2997341 RepID=A0ABT4JD60_9RHOB|nr:hypothetical protein [Paracoccus sp. EF6]MCZ0964298.1 hypothetical protein [Paracoccus sp. EF6]